MEHNHTIQLESESEPANKKPSDHDILTSSLSTTREIGSHCHAKLSVKQYSIRVVESNSARAVGHGGVPVLLNMFYDWHRSDAKNRHVALRKAILNVLKHCTNLSK